MESSDRDGPVEVAVVGDLTENQPEICQKLLEVEPGSPCVLYFDSPGGSSYAAIALASMIRLRRLQATGVVLAECSSAALWPLAACVKRIVTPYSALLFHAMKWQSEEHVGLAEAVEWARHFEHLEGEMDRLLADLFDVPVETILQWSRPGRYVSGKEFAEAGLAELVDMAPLACLQRRPAARGIAREKKRR